jgi:uncharacterized protein
MATVVVTGATGLLGRPLVRALAGRGDRVIALTRDPDRARAALGGDAEPVAASLESGGPWQDQLAGADAVVHLAGEPLAARRWNARIKQLIRDSRVESTRALVEALARAPADRRPRVLACASGADYYDPVPPGDDADVDEARPDGDTFLARVCAAWEAEAVAAEPLGVRVVRMRSGVVLGPGGALDRMRTPFKLMIGGPLGRGRQWLSWIHLDDAVAGYLAAIDDDRLRGPVNLVAPEAARARDLARAVGKALHRPAWLPVPGLALRAAVGELADYLLAGRKVVPRALEAIDFRFRHPHLDEAVAAALSSTSS